jgi:hypothetical protein
LAYGRRSCKVDPVNLFAFEERKNREVLQPNTNLPLLSSKLAKARKILILRALSLSPLPTSISTIKTPYNATLRH